MGEPRKREIKELCARLERHADTSRDFGFDPELNAIYEVQKAIKDQLSVDVTSS